MQEVPLAVANRMLFAIIGAYATDDDMLWDRPPVDSGAAGVGVTIVPDSYWEKTGYWADYPLFLEEMLASMEAESPNESSHHLLAGIKSAKEAAWALLDAGFVWDKGLQESLAAPALPWVTEWMEQGAPGRPSGAPKSSP